MTPPWLQDTPPDLIYRPLDYFVVQVCQSRKLTVRDRVDAARQYHEQWGEPALLDALTEAAGIEPLPAELAALHATLTARNVA